MDEAFWSVAVLCFGFFVGVVVAYSKAKEDVQKDCRLMQQFRVNQSVFTCKEGKQ